MPQPLLLIVDDEKELLKILKRWAVDKGYEVKTASDGDEAMDIFVKDRPDLVLIDIHMPNLDGISVLREMREADPKAAIIVMSGEATPTQAKIALEDGARDFVGKPIDLTYLQNSIEANILIRGKPD